MRKKIVAVVKSTGNHPVSSVIIVGLLAFAVYRVSGLNLLDPSSSNFPSRKDVPIIASTAPSPSTSTSTRIAPIPEISGGLEEWWVKGHLMSCHELQDRIFTMGLMIFIASPMPQVGDTSMIVPNRGLGFMTLDGPRPTTTKSMSLPRSIFRGRLSTRIHI